MFGDIRGRKGGNIRNGKTYFPKVLARQARAIERQEFRSKLSPAEQLMELDKRLGKGIGAAKERARLMKEPTSKIVEGKIVPLKVGLTQEEKQAKKAAYKAQKALPKFAPQK